VKLLDRVRWGIESGEEEEKLVDVGDGGVEA